MKDRSGSKGSPIKGRGLNLYTTTTRIVPRGGGRKFVTDKLTDLGYYSQRKRTWNL